MQFKSQQCLLTTLILTYNLSPFLSRKAVSNQKQEDGTEVAGNRHLLFTMDKRPYSISFGKLPIYLFAKIQRASGLHMCVSK